MIYAVTPTGCRPQGLALLGEYLNDQTYSLPLTWIVVDDCDPETRIPWTRPNISVIPVRPAWRWKPGQNTQAQSLLAGLAYVPEDAAVLILEDDDVYLPDHVSNLLDQLNRFDLVGERDSRYYNVHSSRYRVLPGRYHASLCSVGMKGAATERLRRLCEVGGKALDMKLWRTFAGAKRLLNSHNVVGIKGLPGRPGIGVGHRDHFGSVDDGTILRAWLGDLADNYGIFAEAA